MFGYIRIFRQGLDDDEFLRFSAYYCGLCKELGKTSAVSRLGLSYDMTFLAILLAAVLPEEDSIIPCRCMLHPFKKKHKISPSKALSYAADMSIILAYRKLEDDLNDENSIKARCGTLFYAPAFKKVRKRYAEQDEKIAKNRTKSRTALPRRVRLFSHPILSPIPTRAKRSHGSDTTSAGGYI